MTKPRQKKTNWHVLNISAVLEKNKTSKKGLTKEEVKKRLKQFGANTLPEKRRMPAIKIFLNQFTSPLIYILVIAGIITLALQDWTDSVVIFAAVFLNTIVGFFQENKASKIFDKLKKLIKQQAVVIRNGQEKQVKQADLVPGDIIVLQPGDKIPADARLIKQDGLKINEAALTGEWLPINKTTEPLPEKTSLADRKNMVFTGTVVEDGRGRAVVTATGLNTALGEIALSIRESKEEKTPYQKRLIRFGRIITAVVGVFSVAIFIGGIITGKDVLEMFVTSIAVAIAAIPEGLPVAMTVILALGMERISRKKGLVRKLVATETLGSTQIIGTDKTGTLTQAKMQVAGVYTGKQAVSGNGKKYLRKIDKNGRSTPSLALKIGALCNEAFIENPEDAMTNWRVRGTPTEKALLLGAIHAGLNRKEINKQQPVVDSLPFEPVYKYSANVHQLNKKKNVIYVLGAPEIILENAKYLTLDGKKEKLSEKKIKELTKMYEKLDSKGLRVLATGYKEVNKGVLENKFSELEKSKKGNQLEKQKIYEQEFQDMVFVGFIALRDPLRKDVKQAMKLCRKAGMTPIIITGDHRLTAKAIAEELGFSIKEKSIIEGKNLEEMDDEKFNNQLKNFKIYARVEPKQKLRIIRAWQAKGRVVAMTGDGVNDAPALKQADIGVALGSGTDVAKEASDLILLTDSFSVIVAAIEEGRAIIDNIRKVITFLFADAFAEIILIGLSVLTKLPLPLLPAQILWVNLIEDSLPAVSLGFEPQEKDIMKRKPEDPNASLLTKEMRVIIFIIGIVTTLILFGLFLWLLDMNLDLAEIRTIIFAALTIDSIFYIFSCKNLRKNLWQISVFSNWLLVLSWFFAVFMLLIGVYVPMFQTLLKTVPLNLFDWALVFGIGFINLFAIELIKFLFIKKEQK